VVFRLSDALNVAKRTTLGGPGTAPAGPDQRRPPNSTSASTGGRTRFAATAITLSRSVDPLRTGDCYPRLGSGKRAFVLDHAAFTERPLCGHVPAAEAADRSSFRARPADQPIQPGRTRPDS
jgi:hypothetical protein